MLGNGFSIQNIDNTAIMEKLSKNVKMEGKISIPNFYQPNYRTVKNVLYTQVAEHSNVRLSAIGKLSIFISMGMENFEKF